MDHLNPHTGYTCQYCGRDAGIDKRCDSCWELETRIERDLDLAEAILARVRAVAKGK
jgi:hypothetical protein